MGRPASSRKLSLKDLTATGVAGARSCYLAGVAFLIGVVASICLYIEAVNDFWKPGGKPARRHVICAVFAESDVINQLSIGAAFGQVSQPA